MARINVVLPDDIEHKLRVAVAQEGGKKGDLSGTITDAIKMWLENLDERERHAKKR
ncbi:MAG: ribbon-helix-helix domain-containing protein [Candidatus Bathyarchaeia archaeon]|jgi:Arc/MetJ-type ribon-helix-helix transcriptional regulator